MDLIVKKASTLTDNEKISLGILGIPNEWPIESFPYSGTVPTGFELMTDSALVQLKTNNQAAYDAWLNALRPIVQDPPPSPVNAQNIPYVQPIGLKNDHSMQPWGAIKGQFISSDQSCVITLSNKSTDGLTFTYNSDIPITPRIGDYVFQNNFCLRAWVTVVDPVAHTITFDNETIKPTLSEGVGHYSKGYYISKFIPDWFTPMYLWGVSSSFFWSSDHKGKNDLIELSIVDANDFFMSDEFCAQAFGCTAEQAGPYLESTGWDLNGEYGHWTKYYDESCAVNLTGKTIMTPDGAPGELIPNLECRISYFTSLSDSTVNEIFLDYFLTAKI